MSFRARSAAGRSQTAASDAALNCPPAEHFLSPAPSLLLGELTVLPGAYAIPQTDRKRLKKTNII